MARRTRLDAELVRRGLARSREQAVALVEAGRVEVRGVPARKAAASLCGAAVNAGRAAGRGRWLLRAALHLGAAARLAGRRELEMY